MDVNKYSIVISPENLSDDIFTKSFSGNNNVDVFGVYSGMSYILSGNSSGTSLLTGLTIPVMFTQSLNDIGFYNEDKNFYFLPNTIILLYIQYDILN